MNNRRFVIGILASLGLLAAACGVDDPPAGTTPTPTQVPTPTATPQPSGPLEAVCFSTEAYALEHIVAVIGLDTVPTRFDAINGGGCDFNGDVTEIRVTLSGNGGVQTTVFRFPTPVGEIGVPFDHTMEGDVIDDSLTPGLYERKVIAVAADGRTIEVQGFEPVILVRDPGSVQAQLLRAESRWQRSGIRDYVYEMNWQCFCIREYVAPVITTVIDGSMTGIKFADANQTGVIPSPERFGAMERVFEFLQEAIDRDAASITVEFHQQLGYPTSAFVDYDRLLADEEMGFAVTNLEVR